MTFFNAIPEPLRFQARKALDSSSAGRQARYNHFPAAWAHAMDTPFQWTKQIASHFGGTRNGTGDFVARRRSRRRGRSASASFITSLTSRRRFWRLVGVARACSSFNGVAQKPIEGVSMAYTFDDEDAASKRRTQYFEILANRAIYSDGWVAGTTPPDAPWMSVTRQLDPITEWEWELYHVAEDFSQSKNLAAEMPEKLREMQLLFYGEARKYGVLPIDASKVPRLDVRLRPSLTEGRKEFTYYDGMKRIPEGTAPDFKNRSHTISAEIVIAEGDSDGMIVTQGGRFGGWGLYVLDGRPTYTYNVANLERYVLAGKPLSPGKHKIRYEFKYDGGGPGKGGRGRLYVDGKRVAQGRIERTMGFRISLDETFDVGSDAGEPVSEDYHVPFDFAGEIERVEVELED